MLPPNVWIQVGPDNVPLESSGRKRGIGRVNTVAFHPSDPNIIYIGAPAGDFGNLLIMVKHGVLLLILLQI